MTLVPAPVTVRFPPPTMLLVTSTVPVTLRSSLTLTVPPVESSVRLPDAVSIVLSSVTAILISPKCASDQGRVAEPTDAPSSLSGEVKY